MCSTTYGDLVCRGCRRFAHEVRDWNRYQEPAKRAVMSRLEALQVTLAGSVVQVTDPERLWSLCEQLRVRGARPEQDPLCWAAELLRMGGQHFKRLDELGLRAMPQWEHQTVGQLSEWLTQALYQRAQAEYDRLHANHLRF